MLVDEAKIASLLEHENIAQVYELARAHDEYYIAMEYVDGKEKAAIAFRARKRRLARVDSQWVDGCSRHKGAGVCGMGRT